MKIITVIFACLSEFISVDFIFSWHVFFFNSDTMHIIFGPYFSKKFNLFFSVFQSYFDLLFTQIKGIRATTKSTIVAY